MATGPEGMFVLDTHTGEVKSLVPPRVEPEPIPEPEWKMSCDETREYLRELEQERQEINADLARIEEAREEILRRDPLGYAPIPPRMFSLYSSGRINSNSQGRARQFLAEECK